MCAGQYIVVAMAVRRLRKLTVVNNVCMFELAMELMNNVDRGSAISSIINRHVQVRHGIDNK